MYVFVYVQLTPGVIYMFDIESEDETGVKSDTERFVLDYKDGNLFRMCKEQGNNQGVVTTISSILTTGSNSNAAPTSNIELINVSTTTTTTGAPVQVETPRPNDGANEINSSDTTENVSRSCFRKIS